MNYTTKDNLPAIRVGDTLELKDGSIHKAVKDNRMGVDKTDACHDCSLMIRYSDFIGCRLWPAGCSNFHFKQIKP